MQRGAVLCASMASFLQVLCVSSSLPPAVGWAWDCFYTVEHVWKKPGIMVHACNPSNQGGRGRGESWLKVNAGQKHETSSEK